MEEITPREKDFIVFKVCGALVFQVLGFMGFFFSVWKGNWSSASACLMLEICCTFVLVFSKHHVKGQLHLKYSARLFQVMTFVAALIAICALGGCIAFVVAGSAKEESFDVYSNYAAAPVAFMAGAWSIVLFFDCRKYVHLLE